MLSIESLHPYQHRTVDFIVENPSAYILQSMGLGKTVSTLTAIADLFDQFVISRVLVIGPKQVAIHSWPNELHKWSHLKDLTMAVAVGTPEQRKRAITSKAQITTVNKENVPWLISQYGKVRKDWPFDMVVVDESSAFKSSKALRFKALRKVLPAVDRVVLLTGTPCSASLLDLWSQVYLLDEGERLGKTFTRFRDRYFEGDYMNYNFTLREGAEDKIYGRIEDLCFSMEVEDYLTLPDKVIRPYMVRMPEEAQARYKEMKKDMVLELQSEAISAINAAALSNKLHQMACGFIYDEDRGVHRVHDVKMDALIDIMDSTEGENVLLAYTFKADYARIKESFPEAVDVRDPGAIDAWNNGGIRLLLCHPASAGHGLNLQAGGRRVVWWSLPWGLELWLQLNARLHRQGQTEPVIIHVLMSEGTIEERIYKVLGQKKVGQDALIAAMKDELYN